MLIFFFVDIIGFQLFCENFCELYGNFFYSGVLSVIANHCGGMMTYEINGLNGAYDYVNDKSLRYGANAANNHKKLVVNTLESRLNGEAPILDFMPTKEALDNNIERLNGFVKENDNYLKSLPPIEYEYRYMPEPVNGKIDKKALFSAAYEEMGTGAMSVREFENKFLPGRDYTVKPLDINNDGYIDVSEYGANILAADMLSKPNPNINNINGSMNSKGMNAVMEYARISNAEAAAKLYSQIYSTYSFNEVI